jgi:hypothetical protein
MTVDFSAAGKLDPKLLFAAINALKLGAMLDSNGHTVYFGRGEWIDTATGKSSLATTRDVSELKQAYSSQLVLSQARKYGWTVKQTGNKYVVVKR